MNQSPLGKTVPYLDQYDPTLLFPIPRESKRIEIGIRAALPFYGSDTWNAFELSWLNSKGKPIVALARIDISCDSQYLIESKSFKLYLNSFNNTRFESKQAVQEALQRDLAEAAQGDVDVIVFDIDDVDSFQIEALPAFCIDDLDIETAIYTVAPRFLTVNENEIVREYLYSNLLKSNCLVTGQPDWGTVSICYVGNKINHEGLLKYIISFRNHNEFHEQCVERIFMDIMQHCHPKQLTVHARYTRRGGLDINPVRSTENIGSLKNTRLVRQ
jgi:7-cyano-7-deazaguanine reductase